MEEKSDHGVEKSEHDDDRREFLKTAGKFAATVPPAMVVLMSTTLTSNAIAASGGNTGPTRPPVSPSGP